MAVAWPIFPQKHGAQTPKTLIIIRASEIRAYNRALIQSRAAARLSPVPSDQELRFMSAELVPLSTHPAAALPAIGTPTVIDAWLRARNPNTVRGYHSDLERFREWLGTPSTAAAIEALLSAGQAAANLMVMNYVAALVERGLAGATIARRLVALRSMVKIARKIGRTNWSVDVEGPRVEACRDMRGPDLLDVRLL
jgi:hypothetical protein